MTSLKKSFITLFAEVFNLKCMFWFLGNKMYRLYSLRFSLNFGFMRTFLLSKFEKGFIGLVWALEV